MLLKLFAPLKVNTFLHITGRRENGYHTLQSHFMFGDIGDGLIIEENDSYNLSIFGDHSDGLNDKDNIVTRAVKGFCTLTKKQPHIKITLDKNIPQGAGLGGGSSDATTIIRGLIEFWGIRPEKSELDILLQSLGADVPACFERQSCFVEGIGEEIKPIPSPSMYAVLVHPNVHCDTATIFKSYDQDFSKPIEMPEQFETQNNLIEFLKNQRNDLTLAACQQSPAIEKCLNALNKQEQVLLSRMSGSGSSCFGICTTLDDAKRARESLLKEYPQWWIKAVTLS